MMPFFAVGGAALPFVAVGEADREIGAGPGIMQGVKALAVQPFGAVAQRGVVLVPGRNRIIVVDARGGEDRLRQLATATSSSSPGKTRFAQDALG